MKQRFSVKVKATDQTSDERVTVESAYRTDQPYVMLLTGFRQRFPLYTFHPCDAKPVSNLSPKPFNFQLLIILIKKLLFYFSKI